MQQEEKNIDNTVASADKKSWLSIFNSNWVTNNISFFLFLSFLAVLYIANGHWSDKTVRNIDKTKRELRDLQFEYKTVKAELMHKTEESEVLKVSAPLGLGISTQLPERLQLQKVK